MKERSTDTLRGRLRAAIKPTQWARGLAVWVPLAVLLLALKASRIASLEQDLSVVAAVELIASELFVVVGLAALGFGLFARFRDGVSFQVAAGAYQLIAAVVAVANTIGHHFYVVTGSGLDWNLLGFGLAHWSNVSEVVLSEVSVPATALLAGGLVYFVAGPPLIAKLWREHSDDSDQTELAPASTSKLAGGLGVALVCLLVALIPSTSLDLGDDFLREVTLHLAATAWGDDDQQARGPSEALFDTSAAEFEPVSDKPRKNVVFVILESTRADAVTPYNPQRKTTPYLAELAEQSVLFEEAYAVLPHTSKALVAMLCGIPPKPTMHIVEAVPGNIPGRCLPDLLGDHGYESVFFQNATAGFEDREKLVDKMGYTDFYPLERMETDGFEKSNYFGYEEAVMLPVSRRWLSSSQRSPFMATYLTLSPHHDYLAPRRYGRHAFDEDDTFNRYLNAVHYLDNFLKELIDQYKELGLYESTLFIIVADHGEAFGEHGRNQHDNVLYQEGIHVPFLIHAPQTIKEGMRISKRVGHLDILPTVAEMLGFRVSQARLPGTSVFRARADRPHFFSCWYQNRCIGSRFGPYKYIHHYGSQPDELFNLDDDPAERDNVAAKHPELVAEQRQYVLTWRALVEDVYDNNVGDTFSDKVRRERPEIANEREVNFDDHVKLLGYDLDIDAASPGQTFEAVLYFEVLQDLSAGVGAAFMATDGDTRLPVSHAPLEGIHPMPQWKQGQFIIDPIELTVPDDWQGDTFALELVMGVRGGNAWRFQEPPAQEPQKVLRVFDVPVR